MELTKLGIKQAWLLISRN